MLNPDGVANGSHRCGLAGTDLNRAWKNPCPQKSPTIFWTKMLWKYLVDNGHRPLVSPIVSFTLDERNPTYEIRFHVIFMDIVAKKMCLRLDARMDLLLMKEKSESFPV
jgi:hypothetical protein